LPRNCVGIFLQGQINDKAQMNKTQNMIGIIQGRLLPKYNGQYQAHPVGYWKEEFPMVAKEGLDCIEFILDYNDFEKNPLLTDYGVEEILQTSEQTKVEVRTICADYFMEAPLHSENENVVQQSLKVLRKLISSSSKLGITDIVIPCVDQSSLAEKPAINRFVKALRPFLDGLESQGINLSLETDLAPQCFLELLDEFDSDRITVNYDIGNSVSLGYNLIEELDAYGDKITDIHIKDRVLGGGSVTLGEGDADFDLFFDKLKGFNYKGAFIMQAFRDDEGVMIFKKQLEFIKPYIGLM